jgi:ureidoglycolate hydrolase
MAEKIILKAKHISEIDFSPFGQVLDPNTVDPNTKIYPTEGVVVTPHIGVIECEKGEVEFTHLHATQHGYTVELLERHLLCSQSFTPLNGCAGLFVLVPPEDPLDPKAWPDLSKAQAIIFDGSQGLNLRKACWHTAPYAISEESNYVMVTRKGTLKDDLTLVDLTKELNAYFEMVL